MSAVRMVAGAMTGTSIDGIDVALAAVRGGGLDMQAELVRNTSRGLGALGADLRRAAGGEPLTAEAFARLALELGRLHADAIAGLVSGDEPIDLIAVHGQTIIHRPPVSWQIVNPAPIAARFGCPVVCDLRQADLAAGGQGAPITPVADWVLFRVAGLRRAVVNLGGFCNVTVLADGLEGIEALDVCVCNHVLDEVARRALDAPFDDRGAAAVRGRPDDRAVAALSEMLGSHRGAGRSLGTGDEAAQWVANHLDRLAPDDLAASAAAGVGRYIAEALTPHAPDEALIAGGGARNLALVDSIRRRCPCPLRPSDELGVPVQAREALAVAVLGVLCADGVPITLPRVTGCADPAPLAGTWQGLTRTPAASSP